MGSTVTESILQPCFLFCASGLLRTCLLYTKKFNLEMTLILINTNPKGLRYI